MDVVGSEIGQKMRSAIKAKLTELGCYVDDELPDYVMVMVANKRTRAQMEDDLQLFLGENTELFVNWLHQVLKKLQEVTIATPIKPLEKERSKSKEKKSKEKKSKRDSEKKAKKKEKEKEKSLRKKEKQEKKLHKSKKKHKHSKQEIIRPNVPPLLMNIEKESEPSITDVFAGQILKNHGVILETHKPDLETKQSLAEVKRPILPIIDPATILPQSENVEQSTSDIQESVSQPRGPEREEQIKEINEIEAKIQGLKQKLVEQLDSMSEDEDFLNIRTEAEELMNDFAEDVYQEISKPAPFTPPIQAPIPVTNLLTLTEELSKEPTKVPEELPQIELRLPKRSIRERLGAKQDFEKTLEKTTKSTSPDRFTPEREPEFRLQFKSAKSRLGEQADSKRKVTHSEEEVTNKKVTSRVSVLENRPTRSACASVVRVRPRPRVTPSSSLLLKAMADAHKSLFNIPPKVDKEPSKVKRAMVLPMRRTIDATNIVIQVAGGETERRDTDTISLGDEQEDDKLSKSTSDDLDKEEYIPSPITKVITNTEYVPSHTRGRTTRIEADDKLIIETINIHKPTTDKDKDTQFIVTMDGFNPNAFLAKKLMTEGLLDDDILDKPNTKTDSVLRIEDTAKDLKEKSNKEENIKEKSTVELKSPKKPPIQKRLSDTSTDSDTQVIINVDETKIASKPEETKKEVNIEKRKSTGSDKSEDSEPKAKKKRASPIVFNVFKTEEAKERVRERTESASSDNVVTVPTTTNTNKYDSLPPLDKAAAVITPPATKPWCRSFPSCRFGSSCAFTHPKCKFAASCTRRGCVYSHPPSAKLMPVVSSHVVPAPNFKSITASVLPSVCKFFPNCVNPVCHFYHPKPCRYGKACLNKIECNFYHSDSPNSAFRYPV